MSATTARSQPDPALMRGVIPYVGYRGHAGAAVAFYAQAFGASELGRMADPEHPERLMHAQVEINGGALMLSDHGAGDEPAGGRLAGMHMQLVVEDGRAWWDRALAAGCTVVAPYERQFWGDDWGMLEDPFGIKWAILEPGRSA